MSKVCMSKLNFCLSRTIGQVLAHPATTVQTNDFTSDTRDCVGC